MTATLVKSKIVNVNIDGFYHVKLKEKDVGIRDFMVTFSDKMGFEFVVFSNNCPSWLEVNECYVAKFDSKYCSIIYCTSLGQKCNFNLRWKP